MDPLALTVVSAIVGALATECFRKLFELFGRIAEKRRQRKAPLAGKHFEKPSK